MADSVCLVNRNFGNLGITVNLVWFRNEIPRRREAPPLRLYDYFMIMLRK